MKRFLITTALEETWRDGEPVLFLGEWCRRYSRKVRWEGVDADVLPYHWDDRGKLYADYLYLQDFHERLLADLSGQLNQIHGVDHGVRYWRILIGPWLGYFTQMLFDRWCSVQQAISQSDLSGTIVLRGHEETLVPRDMSDFNRLSVGDEWNHHLYSLILQQFTATPCIERERRVAIGASKSLQAGNWKRWLKRTAAATYSRVASVLSSDSDAFMIATYLPIAKEMMMHRRFGQVPQLWRSPSPVQIAVSLDRRQWVVGGANLSEFEECVRAMIPRQIPTVYLEGYSDLIRQIKTLPWPKHPKLVWTSSSQYADDVFKGWLAEKAELGSPLVIGQHGGHYGTGLWSFIEDHEIAISDCYLSWGWSYPGSPKVKPLGQLKAKQPLKTPRATQSEVLLVACTMPRQSYHLYSAAVSSQWLNYFDDQCRFVELLPPSIRDALTIRLYPQDYGWDQKMRWKDRFPSLRLDDGLSNINGLIRRSRLYIATYNATTFLESFTMNVPTVMFWNPRHWELRDSALPFFQDLTRAGIFHESPESAAHHVAAIWDDVDGWWSAAATQTALIRFKKRYCDLPSDLMGNIEKALRGSIESAGTPPGNGHLFLRPDASRQQEDSEVCK